MLTPSTLSLAFAPRLVTLRRRVDNGRRFPKLLGKRMSACSLVELPVWFSKRHMTEIAK